MIFVGLGANLGWRGLPPAATLAAAVSVFPRHGLRLSAISRLFTSPAWPDPSEPPFVNAVARVTSALGSEALLAALHAIEAEFGRVRSRPNAPRTLDLDLLDHAGAISAGPGLVLPHPRLRERPFVLLPLHDVAPDWTHPATGETLSKLIAALPPGWTCAPAATEFPWKG